MKQFLIVLTIFLLFSGCSFEQTAELQTAELQNTVDSEEALEVSDSKVLAYPWEFGLWGNYDNTAFTGFSSNSACAWVRESNGNMRFYNKSSKSWINDPGYIDSNTITFENVMNYSTGLQHRYELRLVGSSQRIYYVDTKSSNQTPSYLTPAPANTKEIAAAASKDRIYIYALTTDGKLYEYNSARGYFILIDSNQTYVTSITCVPYGGDIYLIRFFGYYGNSFAYVDLGDIYNTVLSVPKNSSGYIAWVPMGRYYYQKTTGTYRTVQTKYLVNTGVCMDAITYDGAMIGTGFKLVNGILDFEFDNLVNRTYCITGQ